MKRNTLKKTVAFVLALTLVTGASPVNVPGFLTGGTGIVAKATVVGSGTCGDNVTWSLNDSGTLTVSGTGAMADYTSDGYVPWYSSGSSITNVVIESGVTSIGVHAFGFCSQLTNVDIPSSVTSIGNYAFYPSCSHLTSVTIPNGVTSIGIQAFAGSALTSVTIPSSVTSIDSAAFMMCQALANVTFTPGTAGAELTIGNNAFKWTPDNATVSFGTGNTKLYDGDTDITATTKLTNIPNKTLTWKANHTHAFTYTLNEAGDTITATCDADGCPLDDGSGNHTATLTIAPSSTGGNTAELTGDVSEFGVTNAEIKYQRKISTGWENITAPESGANGFFKASITVGGETASVTYGVSTVGKGNATNPAGKNYDFTVPTAAAVGSKIKPTPTPTLDTGYGIKKITVKDEHDNDVSAVVQADAEGFIMPDYNVTVDVEFGMIDYTITKNTATNGTFTVKNGENEVTTAHYGDTVTLTAEPDDGYVLSALTVKDSANFMMELSGSGNTRTFTMPAQNVTVTAEFREKKNTGVTLNATGTGGTASLMKNDYSELKPTDQVKEGEKFILCVDEEDGYDFQISGANMTEFTADEYKAYLAYAKEKDISVPANTVMAWVTMPYVAEGDLNLNVDFAKLQTFTVLYQPTGTPEKVWCKFAVDSGVDGDTGSKQMKSDAVLGDGTKVFSLKVTSAFSPKQVAFVTDESELETAAMNSASVNQSTDSWTDISGDKYVIIGGDAQTVVTAFVSDANAMKAYKDNAVDAATANDGVTYRLAVVTNGNAATVAAPAAPAFAPEGKEFAGWRGFEGTAPNLTEKIYQPGDSISVSENTSLNAVWKLQTPSIKLNLNGGIGVSDVNSVTYGQKLAISQNPTREGYSFEGWTVGKTVTESGVSFVKGSSFDLNTPITADLELTAQWKHEHSYSCYQISDFGDSLAKYQKYASAVHIAVCGCEDVELVAHEFDSNGKCACGYQIPTSDDATLEVSYGQMSGGNYTEKMAGMPETAKKNQEVSICAPTTWGNLEFSKWVYSTDGKNWYDLTADAYASFLIPCNMQVRALYVNPVTVPQVELFARPYDDQAVVDGKTYTMDNMLFQMNYKLPDGYSFVDAGIRLGDNAGISYYELKERTHTFGTAGRAIAIGVATVTSILDGGINTVDLNATETYYAERENSVLEEMSAAELAKHMYESKPINAEKYDPIYWEATAKTKGMSGSMATLPPLRFAQKNNQNHYIYGIGWMRYKDSSGNIKTIYTDALPATVKNIPSNPVTKSGS